MNTENEKVKQVGGQTEGFTCKLCYKLYPEEEGRMSKSGMICDNCDEEPDFDNSENTSLKNSKQKIITSTPINTFTNQKEKSNEKSIQLSSEDIENLNNQVEIPQELNIIDCPDVVNPNSEWFRIQFRNFWRLFNGDDE